MCVTLRCIVRIADVSSTRTSAVGGFLAGFQGVKPDGRVWSGQGQRTQAASPLPLQLPLARWRISGSSIGGSRPRTAPPRALVTARM